MPVTVWIAYRNNPLLKVNDLRGLHFDCLGLCRLVLAGFVGDEKWIAVEQSDQDFSAAFFIGRNKESLLPIDLLIDKAKGPQLRKLVRVGSAQFNDGFSVNECLAEPQAGNKFDLIAFGLLDSHTTTAMTNARLDHYVYTQESLNQVRSILKPGTYTGVYPFDEHESWTRSAAELRRKGKKNG